MPEYVRVRCEDTGTESSIQASAVPHGNYTVLDEDAVSPITGDVLPPVFPTSKAPGLSSPSDGQKAEPKKESK